MFITWLLGIDRFCPTVKYGRYSLKGTYWHIETMAGLQSTQPPLDQAQFEALKVSEALRRRLGRRVPVRPALVFPDMERNRGMERLAGRSRIPLLWNLEGYTAKLAEVAIDPHFPPSLERSPALAEISMLLGRPAHVSMTASRSWGWRSQSTPGP